MAMVAKVDLSGCCCVVAVGVFCADIAPFKICGKGRLDTPVWHPFWSPWPGGFQEYRVTYVLVPFRWKGSWDCLKHLLLHHCQMVMLISHTSNTQGFLKEWTTKCVLRTFVCYPELFSIRSTDFTPSIATKSQDSVLPDPRTMVQR